MWTLTPVRDGLAHYGRGGGIRMTDANPEPGSPSGAWTRQFTMALSALCSVLLLGLAGVLFVSEKTVYVIWWLAVAGTAASAMAVAINERLRGFPSHGMGRLIVALISITAWVGAIALT